MRSGKYKQIVLLQHVRCPECGVPMVERVSGTNTFYGCARFPLCIGSRPQGEGVDSYSKLLHTAYLKATQCLSGPRFVGPQQAQRWLLSKAFDREPTEDELEANEIATMANEHLERGIDAACAYVSEVTGNDVDFLLFAHEERYAALQGRLSFTVTAEQIQRMPKAEITRRYDTSGLSQFEANLSHGWKADGVWCPRCGSWSEHKQAKLLLGEDTWDATDTLGLKPSALTHLFKIKPTSADEVTIVELQWECGNCGVFKRVDERKGRNFTTHFEFDEDKVEGAVPGTSLGTIRKR